MLAVSPLDIEDTIDQLYEGLAMSAKERQRRFALAREVVLSDTLGDWISNQPGDVAQMRTSRGEALRRAG